MGKKQVRKHHFFPTTTEFVCFFLLFSWNDLCFFLVFVCVCYINFQMPDNDVIAMSLAYYSRDIGVKSLALFLLSSNLLVRLKPWASAQRG